MRINRKWSIIICILFIILIVIQHSYVFMYFDDFGYASLSYGWTENPHAMSYTLKDIFDFLKWHYMNWGGRVLYFFFEIVAFKLGGVKLIQIIQTVIVIMICYLCGRIIACLTKGEFWTCFALFLILWGTMQLETVSDGLYWYSASIAYVWPFLPFFGGLYYLIKKEGKNYNIKDIICLCLLFFVASFSQEQVAALIVVFMVLLIAYLYVKKKLIPKHMIFICFSSVLGALLTILSPGNFARNNSQNYYEFYDENIIHRSIDNLKKVIDINIGSYNYALFLIFTIAVGLAMALYYQKKIFSFAVGGMIICVLLDPFLGVSGIYHHGLRLTWITFFVIVLTIYYYKNNIIFLLLLYSGICSQCVLLISPSISIRCHIILEIIFLIILAECVIKLFSYDGSIRFLNRCGMAILSLYSIYNMAVILRGYESNWEINQINHYNLIEASKKYKVGSDIDDIIVYRLYNDKYAGELPYHAGFDFIEYWMKNFYELPQSIRFKWMNIDDNYVFRVLEGNYWEDNWLGKRVVYLCNFDKERTVTIKVNSLGELEGTKLICTINDKEVCFDINKPNDSLSFVAPEGEYELIIEAEKTFVPTNGDSRELSINCNIDVS